MQPFVASTEVVSVPLASDRPITVLHGLSRPAMWSHRSRDVPTYDQQVRLTPVDSCLCKEGRVCSQCEHTHPSHGHASPEHLCSTLRLRAPPRILSLRGVYVGVSAGYQCTSLLLLLVPPFFLLLGIAHVSTCRVIHARPTSEGNVLTVDFLLFVCAFTLVLVSVCVCVCLCVSVCVCVCLCVCTQAYVHTAYTYTSVTLCVLTE